MITPTQIGLLRDLAAHHRTYDEDSEAIVAALNELATLREDLKANAALLARQTDLARQAEIELAQARKDTERMDWLENHRSSGVGASRTKRLVGLSPDGTCVREWKEWEGETVREAIDAALAAKEAKP